MERYDITIQMLGVEASGPQYVWEKVPAEEGELVLYTDAQATIAALQARVQELEARQHFGACAKCLTNAWRICKEGTPDAVEMKCSNGSTWWLCDYCLSKEQLTQRTAELEAAKAELNTVRRDAGLDCGDHSCLYAMNKTGMRTNGGCRCSPKRMKNDLERSRKAYDDLQAELERVRGERDEANELVAALSSKVAEYEVELNGDPQNFYGRGRTVGLRTLILALPKVEGEIVAQAGYVKDRKKVYACFGSDADMTAYAALLTHRQGMEG